MKKIWSDEAWEEYIDWQTRDKNILKKINKLIDSIDRNGYNCIGKPEPLKHDLQGFYSVHIDLKNRLVFKITEDNKIEISQCGTHYHDK
jgi:toxin YoeB